MDRLMARDSISAADAKARMDSQMSIEQKRNLAQHMIDNSGSMASTKQQTENLMNELMPSYLTTLIMWCVMFWPALCLYVWVNIYEKVDKIRHVGLLTYRPIPEIVKPQPLQTQDYGAAARAN
jgi:dephospho-CoA kinase